MKLNKQVLKKVPKAVAIFSPSNETQLGVFAEYLNYFKEKNRAGVVSLKSIYLYLLPPTPETTEAYNLTDL